MKNKINVAFFGSPKFAIETLDKLNKSEKVDIKLVVSQKDKKRNRNKYTPTPIKEYAIDNSLEVITPDSVNTNEVLKKLEEKNIDFIVVVAFGQIIGNKLLENYKDRIINLHPSTLPKYRGSSPIQFALLNGDKTTSVTTMLIDKKMDAGDILLQKNIEIEENDNFYTLSDKLSKLGAEAILETLLSFRSSYENRIKQDEEKVTYTKKIEKSDGLINFKNTVYEIINKYRAFTEFPNLFFNKDGENIKISNLKYEIYDGSTPGLVKEVNKKEGFIKIECSNGAIIIKEIQFPGKKMINVKNYLMGNAFETGIIL